MGARPLEGTAASPRAAAESDLPALVDGRSVADSELVVSAVDPGFLRGDGVFEVIRVYGGVALAMDEHLERLSRSAKALSLGYEAEALAEECERICSMLDDEDGYIRLVVTRLGRRLVVAEPPIAFPATMRLYAVAHAVSPLIAGVKALSYAANCHATRLAVAKGCDDALLVDPTSRVLELPFASFGCVFDGRLTLPPLESGILDSITRRLLTEAFSVEVRSYELGDLRSATEACVIGTGMEVLSVTEVVDVARFELDGPVVRAASEALTAHIRQRLSTERRYRSERSEAAW